MRQWVEDIFDDIEHPSSTVVKSMSYTLRKKSLIEDDGVSLAHGNEYNTEFIRHLTTHCLRKDIIVHPILVSDVDDAIANTNHNDFINNILQGKQNAIFHGFASSVDGREFTEKFIDLERYEKPGDIAKELVDIGIDAIFNYEKKLTNDTKFLMPFLVSGKVTETAGSNLPKELDYQFGPSIKPMLFSYYRS